MQKAAQKRSILNKLRESVNLGGLATERLFDPEFKEIMDELRDKTDDPIRSIVSGQPIGENPPDTDGVSCKDLLKSARSNFNRKEYMKCVADLGRFHRRINDVVKILHSFNVNLNKVHHRFLFDELMPGGPEYNKEYAEYLHDLKKRFAKSNNTNLVKQSGILDFLKNIGTERGRALSAWEKRYPSRVRDLKKQTLNLLNYSDKLLNSVLNILKRMATARATRKVDDYIKEGEKIIQLYNKYDELFKSYYNSQIKGFLESQELLLPEKVKEPEKQEPSLKEELPITPKVPVTPEVLIKPEEKSLSKPEETVKKPEEKKRRGVINPALKEKVKQEKKLKEQEIVLKPEEKVLKPEEKVIKPEEVVIKPKEEIALPKISEKEKEEFELSKVAPPSQKQMELAKKYVQRFQSSKESKIKEPHITDPVTREILNLPPIKSSSNHDRFILSLESLSNERPTILAKYILKYAKSIEESDPNTYVKLLNIVNSIKA